LERSNNCEKAQAVSGEVAEKFSGRTEQMSASKTTIGYAVQLGGIGALVLGAVLSAHHIAIAAALLGGAAAFYVGEKIRTLS
jgi:hypothetical protein